MPVTAKLLGDDVANELVEWFNMVDATYRGDLRDLNELNFTRVDAKLEQRAVELDAKMERRFAELDAKLDLRVAELYAKLDVRTAQLESTFDKRLAEMETRLTRRMLGFWIAQAATTVGLVLAVVKLVL